jgi:hypothetical protein
MNWIIRFGQWWEGRRVIRAPEYLSDLSALTHKINELEEKNKLPTEIAKEFMLIRARLDRVELTVGLKREPVPQHVPGTPKIS